MKTWPKHSFNHPPPPLAIARQVANEVRYATDQPLEISLELEPVLELGGFELHLVDLAASTDGCQGLIRPMPADRFRLSVDPTPRDALKPQLTGSDKDTDLLIQRRTRHIAAHEIAHSLFYWRRAAQMPRRIPQVDILGPPNPNKSYEERFCEEFARQLLVPQEAIKDSRYKEETIARLFKVTLPLARLALSGRPMVKIDQKNPAQSSYAIP